MTQDVSNATTIVIDNLVGTKVKRFVGSSARLNVNQWLLKDYCWRRLKPLTDYVSEAGGKMAV